MRTTLDYYNENADAFAESTQNADMHLTQDRFLSLLEEGSAILDFGCGSGRDLRYFMEKGYRVTGTDGSEELCRLASAFSGIKVKQLLFQELDDEEVYDGIWACSSILHLSRKELPSVLRKMHTALKSNGIAYASFKYGNFEGERNGRYFTDFTEESFGEMLKEVSGFVTEECWITGDVRPGREEEKWLNLLLRKIDNNNIREAVIRNR